MLTINGLTVRLGGRTILDRATASLPGVPSLYARSYGGRADAAGSPPVSHSAPPARAGLR